MSLKWTGSSNESGILRKNEVKEKKEELFVFGYSCKLFRDDEKALLIDQGKHLIPWMGDETLKIDRYDARGALHDVSRHEAPPGGYDHRVELTRNELEVEARCDEERYRAMHTNEDEEEMYKEEELKRLHAAGNRQVGFNYDAPPAAEPPLPVEVDEPFVPTAEYKALFAADVAFPETEKQNAIIDKTSKFIAFQGAQMEILIKAKQGDNPQFQFLNRDNELNGYYMMLIALIKAGKWPIPEKKELPEEKPHEHEDYLHPSLSTVIESAPSIPWIHYKPSADCDYTLLISNMRGDADDPAPCAPGELPPPGTAPLPPQPVPPLPPHETTHAHIASAPVMYRNHELPPAIMVPSVPPPMPGIPLVPPPLVPTVPPPLGVPGVPLPVGVPGVPPPLGVPRHPAYYQQYLAQTAAAQQAQLSQPPPPLRPAAPAPGGRSTGLSLMKNYNTDSGSDVSDCDDSSSTDGKEKDEPETNQKDQPEKILKDLLPIVTPPEDVQLVIDKMAAYVARNGAEFAEIVRAKGDPRFMFLSPTDVHHTYYCEILKEKRGEGKARKPKAPVSFSIKKLKEPEPTLPKPALPYESSSEEEGDKQTDTDNNSPRPNQNTTQNSIPVTNTTDPISVKPVETPKIDTNINPTSVTEVKTTKKDKTSVQAPPAKYPIKESTKKSPESNRKKVIKKDKDSKKSPKKDSKKYKEKKDYKEKSKSKRDRSKSEGKEKKKAKEKDSKVKKSKSAKDDFLENEIISLEDDILIDLTGDQSDSKAEIESEAEREKQLIRRRRAAEFLKIVGVDPAAAALPASSLASAMVDTLESLRKKKVEEEEKRRKREKRKQREKQGYEDDKSHRKSKRRKYKSSEDDEESEHDRDSSKRKKRKKDKKTSKSKKKRRKDSEPEEEIDQTLEIDLTTTLKGLRTSSPTKDLVLQDVEVTQGFKESSEEEDDEVTDKKKKEDREYSEGEWSSDSENDSESVPSKNGAE